MSRDKQSQRASLRKEALWVNRVDNGINLHRVRPLSSPPIRCLRLATHLTVSPLNGRHTTAR